MPAKRSAERASDPRPRWRCHGSACALRAAGMTWRRVCARSKRRHGQGYRLPPEAPDDAHGPYIIRGQAPEAGPGRPGVERHDARPSTASRTARSTPRRQKIYPKLAHGRFRALKWLVMAVTLGIYYALPWLRWHRGPDLPDQAVCSTWPTTASSFSSSRSGRRSSTSSPGLLVLAALTLFLVTSLAGRVWCGYTCPQTVWTDLMVVVERFWQGDRNARMRSTSGRGAVKLFKKAHDARSRGSPSALATGGAFVFYFRDAPTLAAELRRPAPRRPSPICSSAFSPRTTYVLGGIAREQVCIYMCPWPRIQGAMVDHETLLVTYRAAAASRADPTRRARPGRAAATASTARRASRSAPRASTSATARSWSASSARCASMRATRSWSKVGRPRGLIAYDTIARPGGCQPRATSRRPADPRAYPALRRTDLHSSAPSCWSALLYRSTLEINVLHDRNPPFVLLSDGSIRNGYTVKILNKLHEPRVFTLGVRRPARRAARHPRHGRRRASPRRHR